MWQQRETTHKIDLTSFQDILPTLSSFLILVNSFFIATIVGCHHRLNKCFLTPPSEDQCSCSLVMLTVMSFEHVLLEICRDAKIISNCIKIETHLKSFPIILVSKVNYKKHLKPEDKTSATHFTEQCSPSI